MKPSQVASELRRIASRIDNSTNPSRIKVGSSIRGLLSHVGSNPLWDVLMPLTEKDANSSQLLWHAMKALGMDNWNDTTSEGYQEVISKMEELAASVGVSDTGYALEYALNNFNTNQKINAQMER